MLVLPGICVVVVWNDGGVVFMDGVIPHRLIHVGLVEP